ncbi:hypothetical protein [Phytomonospora endophytica]|uniref:Cbb3-type cytochrome oxidase subunit 3 n=1 Tax=Phytomonospora endophytica TaxID=714109 RepID=A0A841FG02_9ACTN|nr:hypothetical protein [Phytomonospora endophytica]MBB6034525.1 cbb3-type cytochrome oxidase subunit 3 [Phytomonospora endophytica]GIG70433.1 hypothetical protein Pen01_67280 [Phytomonospora endophytica]
MTGNDWMEVIGAIGVFTLLISTVLVTVWQINANRRARLALAAQRERDDKELTELRTRLERVEDILRQVD